MEFIDLKKQYERIKPQIQDRINQVLSHGKFIMGPKSQSWKGNWLHSSAPNSVSHAPMGRMPYS